MDYVDIECYTVAEIIKGLLYVSLLLLLLLL